LTGVLSKEHLEYLKNARVGRLGTAGKTGTISMVPVVFAIFENRIYFVVDLKKKKKKGVELWRIRNIRESGKAVLLVDTYSEKWEDLSYLLLHCRAKIVESREDSPEKMLARIILKEKYQQYSIGGYFPDAIEEAIFVRLEPERVTFWQNQRETSA
jgi:PPOX class probable F420-dependent enzyme